MRSEFDLIQDFKNSALLGSREIEGLKAGIGDDCAVVSKDSETDFLITTDMLVEDIDFRMDWGSPADLGAKALAVSLSDVAAMGGRPRFSMLSLGLPAKVWASGFADHFMKSYLELARKEGVFLIGGDISKTPDKVVIDSWVLGEVRRDRAVMRSGAKPGDLICVTGSLGGARAGLEILESDRPYDSAAARSLVKRLLSPQARTVEGAILGGLEGISSMIDLSDGLCGDLGHICHDSGVGARLLAAAVPVDKSISVALSEGILDANGDDPAGLNYGLRGGEDFELLFTVAPSAKDGLARALKGHEFAFIGEVTSHKDKIELEMEGSFVELDPKGFSHF